MSDEQPMVLDQSDPDIEAYLIPFVRGSGFVFEHPSRIARVRFEGRDLLVGVNRDGICGVVEGRAVVDAGDDVEFLDRLTCLMKLKDA
jgi:hypothetical protein